MKTLGKILLFPFWVVLCAVVAVAIYCDWDWIKFKW